MIGTTPMFVQYNEIKKSYMDVLLFYRLGDFYEMFGDDAIKASKLLDLALTAREGGQGIKVPMCGVPYHSAQSYINKLINLGEKVAICEQVEDPSASKGIVKREVVRIITKGTLLDEGSLSKSNNYIASIARFYKNYGLAISDVSTGEFLTVELNTVEDLINELEKYNPSECIYKEDDLELKNKVSSFLSSTTECQISPHFSYAFDFKYSDDLLKKHFKVKTLEGYGYRNEKSCIIASGALLDYLILMHKSSPKHIIKLEFLSQEKVMNLDVATKTNLELTKSLSTKEKKDSLLDIIDQCQTAFGSRLLKNYLEKPLNDINEIKNRLNATEILYHNHIIRETLSETLSYIFDIERIVSKLTYQIVGPKDLIGLKESLLQLPKIKKQISHLKVKYFEDMNKEFDTLEDLYEKINSTLVDNPPFSSREGGIIRSSFNSEVQEYRNIIANGHSYLNELLNKEKENSNIKNLKLGQNRVFGYYFEVSNSHLINIPNHFIRKQTLANSERFITEELKQMESKVLSAGDKLKQLELQLFLDLIETLKHEVPRLLKVAHQLAKIDVFQSFASVAINNNWTKPNILKENTSYYIKDLRHPIVEQKLFSTSYVPNDIIFNQDEHFLIITGPNMSGKSTFCRSIACASLLAQIGSFLPAKEAYIPIVDRIFARIGAGDKLSEGQSTFMVEMSEVANIIHNATKNSLVILDEVGRGTSTFDGLSIAWAISEYLSQVTKCNTLFATHYHELVEMDKLSGIKNYSVAVEEKNNDILFLHKIIDMPASKSYGIQVAKLAGIPQHILKKASIILNELEKNKENSRQLNLFDIDISELKDDIIFENEKYLQFTEKVSKLEIENLSLKEITLQMIELYEEAKRLINES